MPWKIDLVLMIRSLIGDLDQSKYTDERLKQVLVVGAYNVLNDADFTDTYVVDVAAVSISPDPISESDTDFQRLQFTSPHVFLLAVKSRRNQLMLLLSRTALPRLTFVE